MKVWSGPLLGWVSCSSPRMAYAERPEYAHLLEPLRGGRCSSHRQYAAVWCHLAHCSVVGWPAARRVCEALGFDALSKGEAWMRVVTAEWEPENGSIFGFLR